MREDHILFGVWSGPAISQRNLRFFSTFNPNNYDFHIRLAVNTEQVQSLYRALAEISGNNFSI